MKLRKLIIDLDGTILDISCRYKALFAEISGLPEAAANEFWIMKTSSGLDNQSILKKVLRSNLSFEDFSQRWIDRIESNDLLSLDIIGEVTYNALSSLAVDNELILCTARRNTLNLHLQLEKLGISSFFKKQILTRGELSKTAQIQDLVTRGEFTIESTDWIIGDTQEDIKAGNQLRVLTCAVLSGLGTLENLKRLQPSFICKNFAGFFEHLNELDAGKY